ncbi:hypothetical protein BC831DRAFT_401562 [Entophlyctis helioformis]|nr:hypothetical protein BC831DRAFT_401562 [Entophlyctis helioformis]
MPTTHLLASTYPDAVNKSTAKALWDHSHDPTAFECPRHKRLLLAVLSTASSRSALLRHFLRTFYSFSRPVSTVDLLFIIGRPKVDEKDPAIQQRQIANLRLEQAIHNDIVVLDMDENMNEGKTYMSFKTVADMASAGTGRTYDFVAKCDDDTFVHLPRLSIYLDRLSRNTTDEHPNMYIGRQLTDQFPHPFPNPAMSGMMYILSWDLVVWLSTSPLPRDDMYGHEDRKMGDWLAGSGRPIKYISNDNDWFEHRWYGQNWAKEYSDNFIAVHRCKDIDWHWDALNHAFGSLLPQRPPQNYRLDSTPDCNIVYPS